MGGGAAASRRRPRPSAGGQTGTSASGSPRPARRPRHSPTAPPPARVVSGGDVMPDRVGGGLRERARRRRRARRHQAGSSRRATPPGSTSRASPPRSGTPKTEKTYTFEGPPAFAPAIAAAGVDVVTMGNNHSVDYGRAALRDTIARLEKAGVQVVGAGKDLTDAHAPAIVKTPAGATIGFLGYSDVWWPGFEATDGHAGVAQAFTDVGRMKKDVKELAAQGRLRRGRLPLGLRVPALPGEPADHRGARRHRRRRRPRHRPPPARAAGLRDLPPAAHRLQPRRPRLRPHRRGDGADGAGGRDAHGPTA